MVSERFNGNNLSQDGPKEIQRIKSYESEIAQGFLQTKKVDTEEEKLEELPVKNAPFLTTEQYMEIYNKLRDSAFSEINNLPKSEQDIALRKIINCSLDMNCQYVTPEDRKISEIKLFYDLKEIQSKEDIVDLNSQLKDASIEEASNLKPLYREATTNIITAIIYTQMSNSNKLEFSQVPHQDFRFEHNFCKVAELRDPVGIDQQSKTVKDAFPFNFNLLSYLTSVFEEINRLNIQNAAELLKLYGISLKKLEMPVNFDNLL